jgi:RNA polymerase sigma factor (sigma-70 family)
VKHLTTGEILEGIRQKNDRILKMIYADTYPIIRRYVKLNNGTEQDAEDVFQEALVLIFRKVSEEDLELTSSFSTYLTALCKFLWNNLFRKNVNLSSQSLNPELLPDIEKIMEVPQIELNLKRLIQKHLLQMQPECQQLLMLFYDQVPMGEIKQHLGFIRDSQVRKRKFICKKKLMERLQDDPEFRDLMDLD